MKRVIRYLMQGAALVALAATATMAQSSGTVTINGSVGNAVSIRWWAGSSFGGATGNNAPPTQNAPLSYTLNLGDVSPNNTASSVGGTVTVVLRSNVGYTLSAQVTSSSGFGTVGNTNGDISLADIGFGLRNLRASGTGSLVTSNAVSGSTIAAPFNNDPSGASVDGDGIPSYSATLNNISASTTVLTGPRISRGGGIISPNNGLLVDTIYAVVPQFFTPTGSFSATVTYTITATP
jgi:hypothetical protein